MAKTNRQVALVTGATSGIGKATARAFADAGFEVVGTGRKAADLPAPAGVTYLDLDVGDDASATSAVEEVIARFGRIDVLALAPPSAAARRRIVAALRELLQS